jgi:phage tail-like protein
MAEFTTYPTRLDPYKNFKFRLKWDGRYACAPVDFGELKLSKDVVRHRDGGDPSTSFKSPGRAKYDPITLQRGLTQDLAFQNWASLVWGYGSNLGGEVSSANFRRDVYLELYSEAAQLLISYTVHRCWASMTAGLPTLSMILRSRTGFHPAFALLRRETSISL